MTEPYRVLVVDDEVALADVIAEYLRREGLAVTVVHDGTSALDQARAEQFDLIVLDVMLPGMNGIEVCRQLRTFSDTYVLMLTARDEEVDKIVGLSVGADDYVVKPFSPRELVARVAAMLRRPRASQLTTAPGPDGAPTGSSAPPPKTLFGEVVIDEAGRRVTRSGETVVLTRTEFDLLATLAAHPRMALSRRQLIDHVWGEDWFGDEHVVDVHIAHLRAKLGDDAAEPLYIRTVRGVGYGLATR